MLFSEVSYGFLGHKRLASGDEGVLGLFETVTDLKSDIESVRRCRYGVIEARDGSFHHLRVRPFPKIASVPEVFWLGGWYHRLVPGNRCWLYYNQPRRFSNYLAVMSFVSARNTTLATARRVLETLDEIAGIKGVDALLCDAANWRLSTAIMCRWGWEPHCPSYWHRHFIRRFQAPNTDTKGIDAPQPTLTGV